MLDKSVNLLKGNILKSLIIFSIPLFISNLFQQLYNTVDVMIVGNYLGDVSLAAVATVISQAISSILCILYIYKKAEILIPKKEHFKFDKELYKELLGQGLSMGIMLIYAFYTHSYIKKVK